ncbi:hypothetical protein [Sphingopyxis sp.]|jgi:predicted permease|uniref:hypothetical protein n=1 Tax=Sphingopyxis sp. TaxID=1908224 RepID=UPI002DE5FFF5|nr:hypothetical protein [Sphingopyxis sp.]
MAWKELTLRSTKILAPALAGGAAIGMAVDIGSQIATGSTDNLLMNIAGWLVFLAFIALIWRATALQIEHLD